MKELGHFTGLLFIYLFFEKLRPAPLSEGFFFFLDHSSIVSFS